MSSDSGKSIARNHYATAKSFLRRYSQAASLGFGLAVAVIFAALWYRGKVGPIVGSLFIGIGSSVIAAAIVAYLSPFSEAAFRRFIALGIDKVWPSREAVPDQDWVYWVRHTKNMCTLLGVAHGNWFRDDGFLPALRDRLNHGVRVKILFLDPTCSAAEVRAREEATGKHQRGTQVAIRESISQVWRFRNELDPGVKERLRLYVYNATPSCGLTWVDDQMIVTHYLAGLVDLTSPAVLLKPAQIGSGGLFDVYAKNVDKIETSWSTELDERNIHCFLPQEEERQATIPTTVHPKGGDSDAEDDRSL
jgi:hypothetical protein